MVRESKLILRNRTDLRQRSSITEKTVGGDYSEEYNLWHIPLYLIIVILFFSVRDSHREVSESRAMVAFEFSIADTSRRTDRPVPITFIGAVCVLRYWNSRWLQNLLPERYRARDRGLERVNSISLRSSDILQEYASRRGEDDVPLDALIEARLAYISGAYRRWETRERRLLSLDGDLPKTICGVASGKTMDFECERSVRARARASQGLNGFALLFVPHSRKPLPFYAGAP